MERRLYSGRDKAFAGENKEVPAECESIAIYPGNLGFPGYTFILIRIYVAIVRFAAGRDGLGTMQGTVSPSYSVTPTCRSP